MSQKITPNLWFDGNAKEAADFYATVFPDTTVTVTASYPNSKEEGLADFQLDMAGKPLTVDFTIQGQNFTCINAGPEFKFNPSISFLVNFDPSRDAQAEEHLQQIWDKLLDGGEVMMELDEYPHSKKYGWLKDKFGLTWQVMLTNPDGEPRPYIIPSLMFAGPAMGRAKEAIDYYTALFEGTKVGTIASYPQDMNGAKAGSLMFGEFMLAGQWFMAMDAGSANDFTFNEAVSLSVTCKDQEEIDYFWEKLSAVPESEQCGWCKDKFGVSWQIVPENMGELMQKPDAFAHMMQMHKIVIADF